jgi:serine/threonine-protein kinase
VAIKRLHLTATEAAGRELNMAEFLAAKTFEYIVPILDAGRDVTSGNYFIVMPICEGNLQDHIDRSQTMKEEDAAEVVLNILRGLEEVPEVAHRDLKPSNILRHDNRWKISDFGIARFIEAATSLATLRDCLTPLYAAPEQWRMDRSTRATDIYAAGCILHALVTGHPPFEGSPDEVRDQHLHSPAPSLDGVNATLAAFVALMLAKEPSVRPTLGRCLSFFTGFSEVRRTAQSVGKLAEVGRNIVLSDSAEEAQIARDRDRAIRRTQQHAAMNASVLAIRERLFAAITRGAVNVVTTTESMVFGPAHLDFVIHHENFNSSESRRWDILSASRISVSAPRPLNNAVYVWSASLVAARPTEDDSYRWFEVAFYNSLGYNPNDPHAIDELTKLRQAIISDSLKSQQRAYGPRPIDGEDEHDFIARWRELVTRAAKRVLERPRQFPIDLRTFIR